MNLWWNMWEHSARYLDWECWAELGVEKLVWLTWRENSSCSFPPVDTTMLIHIRLLLSSWRLKSDWYLLTSTRHRHNVAEVDPLHPQLVHQHVQSMHPHDAGGGHSPQHDNEVLFDNISDIYLLLVWTPPLVLYSGSIESKWTWVSAVTSRSSLITTAFIWNKEINIWLNRNQFYK